MILFAFVTSFLFKFGNLKAIAFLSNLCVCFKRRDLHREVRTNVSVPRAAADTHTQPRLVLCAESGHESCFPKPPTVCLMPFHVKKWKWTELSSNGDTRGTQRDKHNVRQNQLFIAGANRFTHTSGWTTLCASKASEDPNEARLGSTAEAEQKDAIGGGSVADRRRCQWLFSRWSSRKEKKKRNF